MNRDSFLTLAEQYTAVPVHRVLMADTVTPVLLFLKIREKGAYSFLLESVEGGEHLARYSFLGKNPYQVLRYENKETTLTPLRKGRNNPAAALNGHRAEEERRSITKGHPIRLEEPFFDALKRLTHAYSEPKLPDMPRLTGGAVGFSSYDTVRLLENLPNTPPDDLKLPDAVWAFYDEIFAFDHVKHRVILIKTIFTRPDIDPNKQYDEALEALGQMEEMFYQPVTGQIEMKKTSKTLVSNTSRELFISNVEKAKKYIHDGDIFQVVLSQRFHSAYQGDRFMLYRALRMVNPSPYLFYLDFDSFALVGSSPEVLVQVQDEKVRLLPIAGTRPRGKTEEEDAALEMSLKADPKENAEHIMLVDLGRNDLSRVCEPNTVCLSRNRIIERYSHVMHIVSDVSGKMKKGETAVDALKKCFPAGTVSGAPKVRAMEIIDEMEPVKRGPYAGAVGYFDFAGNMDTCIAIRTMVVTDNDIYVQAGAGIVSDSDPGREYDETVNKARALIYAIDLALTLE